MSHKILLGMLLGSFAVASLADEVDTSSDNDNHGGYYLNINTGLADVFHLPTGSWVVAVNAGYDYSQYISAELGYSLLLSRQYGATVNTKIYDLAVKGTLPVSNGVSVYGRLGLGLGVDGWSGTANSASCYMCNNSYNAGYMAGLVGAGVSYELSHNIALRLENSVLIPFTNTLSGGLDSTTFGLQYNF